MKKIIVSIIIFLIVISILIIGIFKNENNDNTNLTKVTVAEVAHSIFYAPQYAAISEGFFEEEGLDIELILTPGADAVMAANFVTPKKTSEILKKLEGFLSVPLFVPFFVSFFCGY